MYILLFPRTPEKLRPTFFIQGIISLLEDFKELFYVKILHPTRPCFNRAYDFPDRADYSLYRNSFQISLFVRQVGFLTQIPISYEKTIIRSSRVL